MAFDETLAARVRAIAASTPGLSERKMFGGIAFLLHGNMSVGIHGPDLIVRLDPAGSDRILEQPGVRPFDLTGRPMKGWFFVSHDVLSERRALEKWVGRGLAFAGSLPAK